MKDEFGLFKNDSTAKKTPLKPKAKPKFEVKWEEDENTATQKPIKNKEKEEKTKKKRAWLDKLKGEEEKKKKVGFEIE